MSTETLLIRMMIRIKCCHSLPFIIVSVPAVYLKLFSILLYYNFYIIIFIFYIILLDRLDKPLFIYLILNIYIF